MRVVDSDHPVGKTVLSCKAEGATLGQPGLSGKTEIGTFAIHSHKPRRFAVLLNRRAGANIAIRGSPPLF